jgi:hypothetical protein
MARILKTVPAPGPAVLSLKVDAGDLLFAWRVAMQARQRTPKGSTGPQHVHLEWHDDRVQLVGVSDLMLRVTVRAEESRPGDLWPDQPPQATSLLKSKDLGPWLVTAAGEPGRNWVTLTEQSGVRPGQLEGHDWQREIMFERGDGGRLVVTCGDPDPVAWHTIDQVAQLPAVSGIQAMTLPGGIVNRLGACPKVAQWTVEFVGENRPVRVSGMVAGTEQVRGWITPTRLDSADPGAIAAAETLAKLTGPAPHDPEMDDDGFDDAP